MMDLLSDSRHDPALDSKHFSRSAEFTRTHGYEIL